MAALEARDSDKRSQATEPTTTVAADRGNPPDQVDRQAAIVAGQTADESTRVPLKGASPAFDLRSSALSSPAVKRFLLARSIADKEPVGDIRGIDFDRNGLATVYAFSEVSGLQNRTLYYHWLHNGRQVAKVRTRIAGKRWRSYSSKYINERMTGNWKVQLRDPRGQVLASAEFVH